MAPPRPDDDGIWNATIESCMMPTMRLGLDTSGVRYALTVTVPVSCLVASSYDVLMSTPTYGCCSDCALTFSSM